MFGIGKKEIRGGREKNDFLGNVIDLFIAINTGVAWNPDESQGILVESGG